MKKKLLCIIGLLCSVQSRMPFSLQIPTITDIFTPIMRSLTSSIQNNPIAWIAGMATVIIAAKASKKILQSTKPAENRVTGPRPQALPRDNRPDLGFGALLGNRNYDNNGLIVTTQFDINRDDRITNKEPFIDPDTPPANSAPGDDQHPNNAQTEELPSANSSKTSIDCHNEGEDPPA